MNLRDVYNRYSKVFESFGRNVKSRKQQDLIDDADKSTMVIPFQDPVVEELCTERLGKGNPLTIADAENITNLKYDSFGFPKYTFENTIIKHFPEFRFFTGITNLGWEKKTPSETHGQSSFDNCSQLEDIIIPKNVKYIRGFRGCRNLKKIDLPEGLEEICFDCFSGCESLTEDSFKLPSTVRVIEQGAFENCKSLKHIIIPPLVSEIPHGCFQNSGLVEITFPKNVKKIGGQVFAYSLSKNSKSPLRKVIIEGDGVELDSFCFSGCNSLTNITFTSTVPPIAHLRFLFNKVPARCKIHCPKGSALAYEKVFHPAMWSAGWQDARPGIKIIDDVEI